MVGVSMNSSALHQIVRDVEKTQELSNVTLINPIEIPWEIFASMRDIVGETRYYVVQINVVTWKVLGKGLTDVRRMWMDQ